MSEKRMMAAGVIHGADDNAIAADLRRRVLDDGSCMVCVHIPGACASRGSHVDPAEALWHVLFGSAVYHLERHGPSAVVMWMARANTRVTRIRPSSALWVH